MIQREKQRGVLSSLEELVAGVLAGLGVSKVVNVKALRAYPLIARIARRRIAEDRPDLMEEAESFTSTMLQDQDVRREIESPF